jgi:deoxyribonuclease-4
LNDLLTGAHVSIAGGLHKAFERGSRLQCRAIQIFLKNSNQWNAKPLTEQDRALFEEARKNSRIRFITAHDSYLINLASPDPDLYRRSLDAFIDELRRANFLGVPYLVMHPGAHVGSGAEAGLSRVAKALDRALKIVEPPVQILLENTAGQGSSLGHRFEQLADLLAQIRDSDRIGVCLDTCHLFAAGYDIRTKETYAGTMREFSRRIGIRKIRAFHVNDSKKDLGSRVDRHCHIGKGCIGLDAFRFLMNDPRFQAVAKILETPKGPDMQEDLMNLATLSSLVSSGSDRRKIIK